MIMVRQSGIVSMEAESGTLNGSMLEAQDAAAFGGAYVLAARGARGSAEYVFQTDEPGDYVVWCRVIAPTSSSDSLYVSMDNGTEHLWDMQRFGDWGWDLISDRSGSDPSYFYLDEGLHTLKISKRETGARIDKIVITSDLGFGPLN